jgi:hypothetical protein
MDRKANRIQFRLEHRGWGRHRWQPRGQFLHKAGSENRQRDAETGRGQRGEQPQEPHTRVKSAQVPRSTAAVKLKKRSTWPASTTPLSRLPLVSYKLLYSSYHIASSCAPRLRRPVRPRFRGWLRRLRRLNPRTCLVGLIQSSGAQCVGGDAVLRFTCRFGGWKPHTRQLDPPVGLCHMAGPGINPVQGFRTLRDLHWVEFTFETGFELPSSWLIVACYGSNRKQNILDFVRWPQIGLGEQDLNNIQRPKSFQKKS